jgi:hypothetical protein
MTSGARALTVKMYLARLKWMQAKREADQIERRKRKEDDERLRILRENDEPDEMTDGCAFKNR